MNDQEWGDEDLDIKDQQSRTDKIHLLQSRGNSACGDNGPLEADIRTTTCEICIKLHDLENERDLLQGIITEAKSLAFEKWGNYVFDQHCQQIYTILNQEK